MTRRAVITGAGAITPHGTLDETLLAVREGRSAIAPLRAFDGSPFGQPLGGEIAFDAQPYFRVGKALKLTDKRTRYAVAAAVMAVRDAGFGHAAPHPGFADPLPDERGEGARDPSPRPRGEGGRRPDEGNDVLANAGVLVGTSGSDVQAEDLGRAVAGDGDPDAIDYFGARILRKLNPLWLLINLPNMASAHVAIQLEARGPNSTITTDWIAGVQAIAEAALWIEDGDADVVIAGGADCGVLPFVFGAYEQAGILSDLIPADGAAMFVIEEESQARARGARILAAICHPERSEGSSGDARDPSPSLRLRMTDPDYTEYLGHALAAAAPIAMALRLCDGADFVVTARGSMGQSASIAVTNA